MEKQKYEIQFVKYTDATTKEISINDIDGFLRKLELAGYCVLNAKPIKGG
jgi:hypothetical protein